MQAYAAPDYFFIGGSSNSFVDQCMVMMAISGLDLRSLMWETEVLGQLRFSLKHVYVDHLSSLWVLSAFYKLLG